MAPAVNLDFISSHLLFSSQKDILGKSYLEFRLIALGISQILCINCCMKVLALIFKKKF